MAAGSWPDVREFCGFRVIASFAGAVLPGLLRWQNGYVTNYLNRGPGCYCNVMRRKRIRLQVRSSRKAPCAKPEGCRWKRGARPSRSLCSASRRTTDAADSTQRLLRLCECCRPVGGTPTGAVETTALPISQNRSGSEDEIFQILQKSGLIQLCETSSRTDSESSDLAFLWSLVVGIWSSESSPVYSP